MCIGSTPSIASEGEAKVSVEIKTLNAITVVDALIEVSTLKIILF